MRSNHRIYFLRPNANSNRWRRLRNFIILQQSTRSKRPIRQFHRHASSRIFSKFRLQPFHRHQATAALEPVRSHPRSRKIRYLFLRNVISAFSLMESVLETVVSSGVLAAIRAVQHYVIRALGLRCRWNCDETVLSNAAGGV